MEEEDIIIILKTDINAQTIFFEELMESPLKEKYSFEVVNTGMEALQLLMQQQSGSLLFSVSSKKELQELAVVLKRLKKEIRNNLFKIAGYNNIKNRKVEKFLKEHHVADIFEGELTQKAVDFKFNLWFRSIASARKKYLSNISKSTINSPNNTSNIDTKLKSNTQAKNPIKFLDPLQLHSDCFILPSEKSAKNVMNSWIIEMIGPGPAAGHWHDITKQTNSTSPIWKWVPVREDLFTFILEDGFWIFKGREPFFNWESNLWKFGGNNPELIFYTDKPLAKKFYVENNQLHITETSEQAKAKISMLKQSFDPKYSMSADEQLTDQTGTAKAEKIDMFYKGEEQGKTDELTDKNIHKSDGFQDKIGESLSGKGSVEHKKEELGEIKKHNSLNLDTSTTKEENHPTRQREKINPATRTAKGPQLTTAEQQQRHGYKEELGQHQSGTAGVDHQQNTMSGSGKVREKIENSATERERTPARAKNNLSTNKPDFADIALDKDLEDIKEQLKKELDNAGANTPKTDQAIDLKKSIAELQKKKEQREREALERKRKRPLSEIEREKAKREGTSKQEQSKNSPFADSLSSILDAPVDLGDQTSEAGIREREELPDHQQQRAKLKTDQPDDTNSNSQNSSHHNAAARPGSFGQHNDAITEDHGDFKETDKDWEKYYRGGAAKKEKEKKKGTWDGPRGNKNQFDQKGSGHYGGKTDGETNSANGRPLAGKLKTRQEQEQDEKKAAFDRYMASLNPKAQKKKKYYEQIGSAQINMQSIELKLLLKTKSKKEGIFDLENEIKLIDIMDNIVVVRPLETKTYMLHTTVLLHCHIHYSGKEYDFTMNGKLIEFEGENQEIINIELTKFDQSDLDNLFLILTERQNNITNFMQAAQGRA